MDGLLIRLRCLVKTTAPILLEQGWSEEEVRTISPYIRRLRDAGDEAGLRRVCAWLSSKLPPVPEGVAVVPVLSLASEIRSADKAWAAQRGGQ